MNTYHSHNAVWISVPALTLAGTILMAFSGCCGIRMSPESEMGLYAHYCFKMVGSDGIIAYIYVMCHLWLALIRQVLMSNMSDD